MNEREYLQAIKSMSCALCNAFAPSDAHHLREGMGMAQRNSDYLTIPLCKDCHQGAHNGIHGKRALWDVMKETELSLLAKTIKSMIIACKKGHL
jgi:hypothetical protein